MLRLTDPRQALDLDIALAERLRSSNARQLADLGDDAGVLTPIMLALWQLQ